MKIENWSYPVNEKTVANFEQKYQIHLPADYREFLIKYNVAYVLPDGFYTKHTSKIRPDEKPDNEIGIFRGFANSEKLEWNLDWYISIYWDTRRILKDLLPISCDGSGNVICIGLSNDIFGKIFFWEHESEGNIICLADNFHSFLESFSHY